MHSLLTPNYEHWVSFRGGMWFVELWRGAAGVIPGLAKVASHSWCYLFKAGDFLC